MAATALSTTEQKNDDDSVPNLAAAQTETEFLGALMGAGPPPPPPKPDSPVIQDTNTINLIENERNMNLFPSPP